MTNNPTQVEPELAAIIHSSVSKDFERRYKVEPVEVREALIIGLAARDAALIKDCNDQIGAFNEGALAAIAALCSGTVNDELVEARAEIERLKHDNAQLTKAASIESTRAARLEQVLHNTGFVFLGYLAAVLLFVLLASAWAWATLASSQWVFMHTGSVFLCVLAGIGIFASPICAIAALAESERERKP